MRLFRSLIDAWDTELYEWANEDTTVELWLWWAMIIIAEWGVCFTCVYAR